MKHRLIAGILIILSSQAFAQPAPPIEWAKCFGGSDADYLLCIIQTYDGGYAAAGYTRSSDGDVTGTRDHDDFWIIKLNNLGVIEWQKTYGGSFNDNASAIIQTIDSGYVIAGTVQSHDGDVTGNHGLTPETDGWVIKLDKSGILQWQKALGGSNNEEFHSIVQAPDGGYILTGSAGSTDGDLAGRTQTGANNLWIVKVHNDGSLQWQQTYGGTLGESGNSIIVTDDGGFAVAGTAQSKDGNVPKLHGFEDFWLLKFDDKGTLQWDSTYGGMKGQEPFSIIQTYDKGYAVAGKNDGDIPRFHNGAYFLDFCVMKIDSVGALQWKNDYGSSNKDQAMSIKELCDGNFIVCGCADIGDGDVTGFHGKEDGWVLKLDPCGSIIWEKCLGGSSGEEALCIIQTSDGGFAISGDAASSDGDVTGLHGKVGTTDGWIVKLAAQQIPDIHFYIKTSSISAQAGDTIEIPLYINSSDPVNAPHAIGSSLLNYRLRTDLITPFAFIPSVTGVSVGQISSTDKSAALTLNFPCFSFTGETVVGKLRCIVYVTDTLDSDITLLGDTLTHQCFSILSDGSAHITITGCGAPTLSNFMKFGTVYEILSITPNPAGNFVQVQIKNNGSLLHYELLDALGAIQKSGTTPENSLQINLSGLSSGNYYFRLSGEGGMPMTKKIVVVK